MKEIEHILSPPLLIKPSPALADESPLTASLSLLLTPPIEVLERY